MPIILFLKMLMSMAVHSSTRTKLLAALAVSTGCLCSVGTVGSDLLSRNDVSIHRSATAKSERGHWTLAHWITAKVKPPPLPQKKSFCGWTWRGGERTEPSARFPGSSRPILHSRCNGDCGRSGPGRGIELVSPTPSVDDRGTDPADLRIDRVRRQS